MKSYRLSFGPEKNWSFGDFTFLELFFFFKFYIQQKSIVGHSTHSKIIYN